MIWLGWILWHINHCRLFNIKSSLYIYIRYIWFYLVEFYGILTIVGYLMPNLLYSDILNICDLVLSYINHCRLFNAKSSKYIYIRYMWFGLVLWHINRCWLFNTKSSLYLYIKYIWFVLIGFYGIATIIGYLMPNSLYTFILNIGFCR